MTVRRIDGDRIECDWFDTDGIAHRDVFQRQCLSLVPVDLGPAALGSLRCPAGAFHRD
jgi:uncharacterized protein YodC (DUF2158 family)